MTDIFSVLVQERAGVQELTLYIYLTTSVVDLLGVAK